MEALSEVTINVSWSTTYVLVSFQCDIFESLRNMPQDAASTGVIGLTFDTSLLSKQEASARRSILCLFRHQDQLSFLLDEKHMVEAEELIKDKSESDGCKSRRRCAC